MDCIAKLAALVPKPRVNLTRYHGVLAPNSKHRINVTPAKHGKGANKQDLNGKKGVEAPVNEHMEKHCAGQALQFDNRLTQIYPVR